MDTVGEKIRKIRKERGWTQKQLAERVNVSMQVVSNWERNYTKLNHEDIERFSKVLNVNANDLFNKSNATDDAKLKFSNDVFEKFDFDPGDDEVRRMVFDAIEFAMKHKK